MSIRKLMNVESQDRGIDWLKKSLQSAVELEHATLPPYLCAMWSIKQQSGPVYDLFYGIVLEEMLHMGLACNLLTTLGGTPAITRKAPTFPGPLPGEVRPQLTVTLQGLTREVVRSSFMEIEFPDAGPIQTYQNKSYPTIGAFYTAILEAIRKLSDSVYTGERQLTANVGEDSLFAIMNFKDAERAIQQIKEEGEGTHRSPVVADEFGGGLAHYYKFGEIYHGKRFIADDQGNWDYAGGEVPFPEVYPVAAIPPGGYPESIEFDRRYTAVLDQMQSAWENGSNDILTQAIFNMYLLQAPARELIKKPLPSGDGNYGPSFLVTESLDKAGPAQTQASSFRWYALPDTGVESRTDDIWFFDADTGWLVNTDGKIRKTTDGGETWTTKFSDEAATHPVYLRCLGFGSRRMGWVGTLSEARTLFRTTDGGESWSVVNDLPEVRPSAICGLYAVDESVVYAAGTNWPWEPARMIRTTDGGASWTGWDMGEHAACLIDTYFTTPLKGWVVGGKADRRDQTDASRRDVRAVVLYTEDGGRSWENRAASIPDLPLGEWGWKIQFLNEDVGFVALENFEEAAILKTVDGGRTWERKQVNDPQRNLLLEGVGFIDPSHGWVGGWGGSSETVDGGDNWSDANEIGRHINRFRFIGNPVTAGYASGKAVYKYTDQPLSQPVAPPQRFLSPIENAKFVEDVPIPYLLPSNTKVVRIDIWDRFGKSVRQLINDFDPKPGSRLVTWNGDNDKGDPLPPGLYIYRITVDGDGESRMIELTRSTG